VQLSLGACGIACPRDTDMQEKALGSALALPPDLAQLRRGDLMFWKGHVAIVRDADTFVHATAFHMMVAIEPIAEVVRRVAGEGGGSFRTVKRLPPRLDSSAPQT
jgi:cell wall-associated NlpC family hydrolase